MEGIIAPAWSPWTSRAHQEPDAKKCDECDENAVFEDEMTLCRSHMLEMVALEETYLA